MGKNANDMSTKYLIIHRHVSSDILISEAMLFSHMNRRFRMSVPILSYLSMSLADYFSSYVSTQLIIYLSK